MEKFSLPARQYIIPHKHKYSVGDKVRNISNAAWNKHYGKEGVINKLLPFGAAAPAYDVLYGDTVAVALELSIERIEAIMKNDQRKFIKKVLDDIAIEKGVRLLYACGGGSREWGFASEHSDYDTYFLYAYPKNCYLRLDSPQDTIERKIDTGDAKISLAGWDIYKALRLLRKSNPPLLEQLFSTTIYAENTVHIETLRNIARRTYSSSSVFYHYSRMAHRNYRQYIANKIADGTSEVPQKKYLYVVRPIVALLYLEQHKALPPTNFIETLKAVDLQQDVRRGILDLVDRKMAGQELAMGTPDLVLNSFAEQHLTRWLENGPEKDNTKHRFQELDDIVLAILEEQWISMN